jgi:hypothetical protein
MNKQQNLSMVLVMKGLMATTLPAGAIGAMYSLASDVPQAQATCGACGSQGYCVCSWEGYNYCDDTGGICISHSGRCTCGGY